MSHVSAKIVANSKFIQIIVVSNNFPSKVVKLVKIFPLKLLKIKLNTVPETVVFSVCGCVLIKLVYFILIEDIMVNCLNLYAIVKKNF